MTEHEGAPYDGEPTPARGGDLPHSPPSGPVPLRPPAGGAVPGQQHRGGGPPAALGAEAFTPAPGTGGDIPYQWPDQPGGVEPDDVTDVVVSPPALGTWGRGAAPAPGAPWQAPGPPFGAPGAGHTDPQRPAGAPYDPSRPPEQPSPGYPERPGPGWQQQQQPSARPPGEAAGWGPAQGSAANWNYVDAIRSSELVPTRRLPPGRGWRKAVYLASFKLINPGQSPDERYQAELEVKVRSLLRGTYKIGVLGKGGVGKSTIAACVGSIFAELRQDDRVVAIDADTAFGKLASRVDPSASGSYWELAADRHLDSFGDIRARVGSNKSGLFVLAGESATARRRVLDPAIYREAAAALDKHFTLSIVDCGSTLDSPVTQEVLADLDALIVVSSPWYDGASAAGQTLEWLANNGFTGLLHRTVVVLNDSDGHAARRDRALLAERFGGRGQKVIEMPFDEHLRPGGVIDVKDEINRVTRRRLMELAAACAEHFAATADRPRATG